MHYIFKNIHVIRITVILLCLEDQVHFQVYVIQDLDLKD